MNAARCRTCHHFENAPAALEAALPGLTSLSSAHAAVRSRDGLCARHDRYVTDSASCEAHEEAYPVSRILPMNASHWAS